MDIKAVIYDLDGTLTDTLADLHASTNHALHKCGFPPRTIQEVRSFVGNGIGRLIAQAVPQGTSEADTAHCLECFKVHYMLHCKDNTCLYDGVAEMLQDVRNAGYRSAIVSNKVQAGVDELYDEYFRGLVDTAIGERTGIPRKPAPDMVHLAIKALGCKPDECVYIGDSEVDVATAHNSGLPCISVLWGFRDKEELTAAGATTFAEKPSDVLKILQSRSFWTESPQTQTNKKTHTP